MEVHEISLICSSINSPVIEMIPNAALIAKATNARNIPDAMLPTIATVPKTVPTYFQLNFIF